MTKRIFASFALLLATALLFRQAHRIASERIVSVMPMLSGRTDTAAFHTLERTQVAIEIGSLRASGSVYEASARLIVIVTARHLFDHARDENAGTLPPCRVTFCDGTSAAAAFLGASDTADAAFAVIDNGTLSVETISRIATVRARPADEPALLAGDTVLVSGGENDFRIGRVAYPALYVASAGGEMLCCYCGTEPGLSGGGVFDIDGNLAGVVSMGSDADELLAVPAKQVLSAYQTLQNK